MAEREREGADYDSTPADDEKPRQNPVAGTTDSATGPGAASGGGEAGGETLTQEGLPEQEEAARQRAEQGGYQ
jgi:hypothetical protein